MNVISVISLFLKNLIAYFLPDVRTGTLLPSYYRLVKTHFKYVVMQLLSVFGTIAPLHTMEASLTFIGHFAMFVLEISSRILDMSSNNFNVIFIFLVLICKYEKLYIYF